MSRIDGDTLAEDVAGAVGSWRFIIAQGVLMVLWVLVNVLVAFLRWDGYPFVFLNLAMSAEAAFTGPVLLIAANGASSRDRAQAARIESLERTLDEHVNVTAKAHTEELRANTKLTEEIHRMVAEAQTKEGQGDDRTTGVQDSGPAAQRAGAKRRTA